EGGSWIYRAAQTREAAAAAEVGRVLEQVEGAPEPLLVAFLDQVEQADPEALDRLAELIRARREQS
ncbi:MAG: putative transcriptional regulator, partial [Myxococcota bacterium]